MTQHSDEPLATLVREALASQFMATLEMLRQAIVQCPEAAWDDRSYRNRFWHVAYHALFYTHLYAQPSEEDFIPWSRHLEEANFMGAVPWPPHHVPQIDEPYGKAELLEYLALVQGQVEERTATLDLQRVDSGFYWIPLSKFELQLYNLRHLQLHTGELCERLGTAGVDVDWVGTRPNRAT